MVTISEKILSEEKIVIESILVARLIKKNRFQHVCYFSNDILFTDLPKFT